MYILEYSPIQKAFHLEKVERMCEINMEQFDTGIFNNIWIPIFCGTWEEASEKCNQLFKQLYEKTEE